jgi:hypothetical protein
MGGKIITYCIQTPVHIIIILVPFVAYTDPMFALDFKI